MEEVQILAARLKLDELRAEIIRTEERFFKELDEHIADPEMRVTCRIAPLVGSRISRRVCEPQFTATANATYMGDLMQGLADAAVGGSFTAPVPPGLAISSKEVTFNQKISAALKDSASLRELAQRRESLQVLLKAAQKARSKGTRMVHHE